MTAHANSLTARATAPAASVGPVMTLPAHDLRVFLDGLGRLGYDVGALLAAVNLRETDFTDPDARVRCDAYGGVFARAQQMRFTPNLALELARVTPLGAWPLLDYLVLTADTVGAGVHQLERYFRLVDNSIVMNAHEAVDSIRVEISAPSPFAIEFDAALLILHFRTETEGRFSPASISFTHSPDDPAAFARTIGCPVTANAGWSGVSVPLESWRLPLRRRDPTLRHMLEAHANALLAQLPARTGLAADVQRALTSHVAGGDVRIDAIARRFAMSARTLQRKLGEEGTSFQKLVDDARREAAGNYLKSSTLAIGEIAYLLGYSEPAPFHRAFKRWYATTPEVFRCGDTPTRAKSAAART
jgi:AraC-like DNA-binding protein